MSIKVIACPAGLYETVELWCGYCECGAKCSMRKCAHAYEPSLSEHVALGFKNAIELVV